MMKREQHVILRLPEGDVKLRQRVRELICEGQRQEAGGTPLLEILPDVTGKSPNFFHLSLEGSTYPALLVDIPTLCETQKTLDKKIFVKASDVGQMLLVFHTDGEREVALSSVRKTPQGSEYYPHGLTPPTFDIVHRRFEKTHISSASTTSFQPLQVKEVIKEICEVWETKDDEKVAKEWIEEEVVEFEDWMASAEHPSGVTLQIRGKNWTDADSGFVLEHPEILLSNREEDINRDAQPEDAEAGVEIMEDDAEEGEGDVGDGEDIDESDLEAWQDEI